MTEFDQTKHKEKEDLVVDGIVFNINSHEWIHVTFISTLSINLRVLHRKQKEMVRKEILSMPQIFPRENLEVQVGLDVHELVKLRIKPQF